MITITVEPAKGRKVRNPENNFQPITGPTKVPDSAFWIRRVQKGDVIKKTKGKAKK